ncbi:hypothetical protein [Rurimicrobium arvi]|uniref:Uncharacterized protein n=1 Tax=Rurimicrobium arvi TaxID=2049916 RepID=A0ABP8N203_9BACT
MAEAIIGLVGVLIGSAISLFQGYWNQRRLEKRAARYLAIRVICVLDKFIQGCAEVLKDDGLSWGQRNKDGCLEPQVKVPGPPIFPDDIDWKSVDHDLMYKILSMPSEVEAADRMIEAASDFSTPPDFEELFNERRYHYSGFGRHAVVLSNDLSNRYGIKKMVYNDWNPENYFTCELEKATARRERVFEYSKNLTKDLKAS